MLNSCSAPGQWTHRDAALCFVQIRAQSWMWLYTEDGWNFGLFPLLREDPASLLCLFFYQQKLVFANFVKLLFILAEERLNPVGLWDRLAAQAGLCCQKWNDYLSGKAIFSSDFFSYRCYFVFSYKYSSGLFMNGVRDYDRYCCTNLYSSQRWNIGFEMCILGPLSLL